MNADAKSLESAHEPDLPTMATPYVLPPPVGPRSHMRPLGFADPFRWLARGLKDMRQHPGIALFYGLCFWGMAQVLALVFKHKPEYTLTLVSGCLLVGPFLAMGLYEVSRKRELGEVPEMSSSLMCWDQHIKSMAMLVLVLMVLELLWGRASLVVFAVTFNTMPSTENLLAELLRVDNIEFLITYTVVGGVFAGLIFVTSVISIPMILDRQVDAISAGLTSMRACLQNPGVMLLWGALITGSVALAMLPWFLGLLVVGPVVGHATWHAYRGIVPKPQQ